MVDHSMSHRVRRRLLVVAIAIVAGWTIFVIIVGAASGLWQGRGPHGGRFVVGLITIGVAVSTTSSRATRHTHGNGN
jgi:hypothetical protein